MSRFMPDPDDRVDLLATLASRLDGTRISRRTLLRRATLLGLAGSVGGVLAACGGGSNSSNTPASQGSSTQAPSSTTAASGGSTATKPPTSSGSAATPQAAPPVAGTPASAPARATGQPGGTLKFGLLRDPIAFDPHINYGASSSSLQGNVYNGLVAYDTGGNLMPSLAESWDISSDGINYTFKLRQDIKFHNGNPFNADDVIFSFDRIRNKDTGATRYTELQNMQSYNAADPNTVKVVLKEAYATLLSVLATNETYMVDKESANGFDFKKQMNGTGAFKLDSYEPNVRYVLVKNPNYWEKGLPYLDRIEQVPIPDDNARVNAFKSGQVNFVEYVPWQNMDELAKDKTYSLYKGFDLYNIVRLNPQKPPLDKPQVRQALNYAVDRKAIIDVAFGGQGVPITVGLIQQGTFWYQQELDGYWKYDPDKAKALLSEVGMKPSDVKLEFLSATISVHQDTAQVVTQQLQKLGMVVDMKPQEVPQLTERRTTGEYQMMMDGLSQPWPDPDFYTQYFGTGGSAYAKGVNYSNPDLDKLLEQGRTTIGNDKRKAIYKQFEEAMLKDAPWMFLLWRPQAEASTANVQGYVRIPGVGLGTERYLQYVFIKK